ncbi:lichenan operon transcriptional antiterminator [Clostridium cavendishii DSM 21758]|uniref:Lichenan operon transcriptional antiterminator n=1 Tax=Clostridium cavendishii DSM 21758 TaxID=1121302 RepID=A0A1M6SIJ4_9CLOT|nr:HTH domain-containing protein [Clostridium cavendishii]SHK44533.1 lichenan operon transcriptional antiterminator [Clostridium cavendishii DSM 21758]
MREKLILEELLKSEKYLNLEYFAKTLNVSSRTVYNDMKYLIKKQSTNGFEICLKRGQGYHLIVEDKETFDKFIMNQSDDYEITPKGRIEKIIAILISKYDYVTIDFLAESLSSSRSIIKSDLEKVSESLKNKNIKLIKKAHYGIKLEADRLNIDSLMAELYLSENSIIYKNLNSKISSQKFKNVEKKLISELKKHKLDTNYTELKEIDAFLKVLIYRRNISIAQSSYKSDKACEYTSIAFSLLTVIEELFKLKFNQEDLEVLTSLLKKKTKVNKLKYSDSQVLVKDIDEFLKKIDVEFNTKCSYDGEFKKSLLSHVSLLIDRLHEEVYFNNPLTNKISVRYPISFNIAILFCRMIEEKYSVKINKDEIAFITTHFAVHMEKESQSKFSSINKIAVICSSGGGSAYLIKLKLETLFTTSNIETFSLLDMDSVKGFEPDIIFTISDLEERFNVPIIYINELIDDVELLKIKNIFKFNKEIRDTVLVTENSFLNLLNPNFFQIVDDECEYLDLLKEMAKQIEEEGYSEIGYVDFVLEREKCLDTIYLNGITIPHPMNMCGKNNLLSIAIIKNNMKYNNKSPRIIFMVSLVKGQLEFHKNITYVLNSLMNNQGLVNELCDSNTYEEFIIKLNELRL